MKKYTFLFITFFISLNGLFAQFCIPTIINFNSQSAIDDFPIDYPDCTEILGSITIQGNDINNLNGLNQLISINGDLTVNFIVSRKNSIDYLAESFSKTYWSWEINDSIICYY